MVTRVQIARLSARIERLVDQIGGAKRVFLVVGPDETTEAVLERYLAENPAASKRDRFTFIRTGVPRPLPA